MMTGVSTKEARGDQTVSGGVDVRSLQASSWASWTATGPRAAFPPWEARRAATLVS